MIYKENNEWKLVSFPSSKEDNLKKEEFTILEYDGIPSIMEPKEAKALLSDTTEQYIVSTIWLTRDQFESLPSFEGW